MKHLEESPVAGDVIQIAGDPTAYNVQSVSGYNPQTKKAVVTLTATLGTSPAIGAAVTVSHANGVRGWADVQINAQLVQGYDQAKLSGDYELDNLTNDIRYEVWPQMLEKAYAEMRGGYEAIVGGNAGTAWSAIMGPGHARFVGKSGHPYDYYNALAAATTQGKRVVVSTLEHPDPNDLSADHAFVLSYDPDDLSPVEIHGEHAYIVESLNTTVPTIKLHNPWGEIERKPWIDADGLYQVSRGFWILEN